MSGLLVLTYDSCGVNPVPCQLPHKQSPTDWSQTSAGPSSVVNNGLPCSMDTPARGSKYIQMVCLKSSLMKIIYLHWKCTLLYYFLSHCVCISVSDFLSLLYLHFGLSSVHIWSNSKIRFTVWCLCVPVSVSFITLICHLEAKQL